MVDCSGCRARFPAWCADKESWLEKSTEQLAAPVALQQLRSYIAQSHQTQKQQRQAPLSHRLVKMEDENIDSGGSSSRSSSYTSAVSPHASPQFSRGSHSGGAAYEMMANDESNHRAAASSLQSQASRCSLLLLRQHRVLCVCSFSTFSSCAYCC